MSENSQNIHGEYKTKVMVLNWDHAQWSPQQGPGEAKFLEANLQCEFRAMGP